MKRATTGNRGFCPFVTPATMQVGQGIQFDWDKVSDFYNLGKFTVKSNGGAAKGAETLPIDALLYKLGLGDVLDFGDVETVTVKLNGNASADATSITVDALTGDVPSGTLLYFGQAKEHVRTTANAVEGDTSIACEALATQIEDNDEAVYQGGRKLAKLTAAAEQGATSLSVEPLQFAIADNAEALADNSGTSDGKRIPQGTAYAILSSGKAIPRRDVTGSEEAMGFTASDADEGMQNAKSGFGNVIGNTEVWENLLPDSDHADWDTFKAEIQANSLGFVFSTWSDDTV